MPQNKSKPTPPAGYQLLESAPSLDAAPAFERQLLPVKDIRISATTPTADEAGRIAQVDSRNPTRVAVFMPNQFGQDELNHELVHTFQDTRSPLSKQILMTPERPIGQANTLAPYSEYDYGGMEGLIQARNAGKHIQDFNTEQQAQIVADYKRQYDYLMGRAQSGQATPQELKTLYRLREAYHPFVQQLATLPREDTATKMDVRPAAPGLPDYSVAGLGVVPADPLMGGRSVYPAQSIGTHKVGERKRFANGKIGVWDGHGWATQPH